MIKILLFLICLFVFIPVKTAEATVSLCGGKPRISAKQFIEDHQVIFAGEMLSSNENSRTFRVLKSYRGLDSVDFNVTVYMEPHPKIRRTFINTINVSNPLGNGILVGANYTIDDKLEYNNYDGDSCHKRILNFSIEELEKELVNEGAGYYISRTNFTYIVYLLSFSLFMTLSLIIYKIIRGLKRKL